MGLVLEFASQIIHTGKVGRPRKEPHTITMIRMNNRLKRRMVNFCITEDISQREFIELAAELLMRNTEMHARMKIRRANLLKAANV